jgi:hypothetical protein
VISVLVTSGNASIGISLKVIIPAMTSTVVKNKMKYRFFNEKPTIARRNLVIIGFCFRNDS